MQKWQRFAVAEGASKTVGGVAQDFVGRSMGTLEMGCVAAMSIGIVEAALGFTTFLIKVSQGRATLPQILPNTAIVWAILFGFSAGIFGTVVSLYTFTLGAEFSARTLLISASIIPGAIIGRLLWGRETDPLGLRQWLGIGLFMIACWAILNFPTSFELAPWVWWTLIITFTQALNELLSRKAADAKLDPFVNALWSGVSKIFATFVALLVLLLIVGPSVQQFTAPFALGAIVLAVIGFAMIVFKFLSYKGGGTMALKKLIMQGTYLTTFTFVGVTLYDQSFTLGNAAGLALFLPAFCLIDKDTWKGVKSLFAAPARA